MFASPDLALPQGVAGEEVRGEVARVEDQLLAEGPPEQLSIALSLYVNTSLCNISYTIYDYIVY